MGLFNKELLLLQIDAFIESNEKLDYDKDALETLFSEIDKKHYPSLGLV